MSYKYLVTLKPVGEFFFGGEQNFSMNDLRNRVSFFAKSFMFMQQNSILGMLRREILRKKGFLKIHINGEWPDLPKRKNVDSKEWIEIKKLVGYEPFCFEKEIETGIIEEISETFLKEKYRVFYPMPFDEKLNPQKKDIEVSFNGRKRKFINFGINPKDFDKDYLISKDKTVSFEDVFKESISVGIKKNSDEEGFFQKRAYKLKDNFEFAFFLTLKEDVDLSGIVKIGGDRSNFILKMQKADEVDLDYPEFSKKEGFERIILLSETYVDEEIENYCDYIFAENLIFRGVRSGGKKTKRARVLKRGSVLYVKDRKIEEVEKLLKNHLYKIGFNRYKRS